MYVFGKKKSKCDILKKNSKRNNRDISVISRTKMGIDELEENFVN